MDVEIPAGALVMIGDGRRALFLRNAGTRRQVELVTERVLTIDNPPTREQGSDRPGRFMKSDGVNRSAMEQTDWHQLAEDRFAVQIAATLQQMIHAHQFMKLVVIAPPRMLGSLRAAFHPEVTAHIIAEAAKDLAARSIPELTELFDAASARRELRV